LALGNDHKPELITARQNPKGCRRRAGVAPDADIVGEHDRRRGIPHPSDVGMLALAARLTGVELDDSQQREITAVLRAAGARFALLHGSRVNGRARPDSDIYVAAWWDGAAPASFEVDLPADVDLVVLNGAPLELAGRIAVDGQLLYDDDPPARVRRVATTRKIYFDERPRMLRAHREFVEALSRGR